MDNKNIGVLLIDDIVDVDYDGGWIWLILEFNIIVMLFDEVDICG